MKPFDEHPVSALRRHCRMYLYGSSGSPELLMNEVARDFFSFAMLHLICTMFITTDQRSDPAGGVFHRVLDPMGMSYLLTDIDRRLDSPIGNTTLRIFVRSKRNKLATHGRLAFSNHLPDLILQGLRARSQIPIEAVQRTGASRFAQRQNRQLAPVANLCVIPK
jgi:hypothetical protein